MSNAGSSCDSDFYPELEKCNQEGNFVQTKDASKYAWINQSQSADVFKTFVLVGIGSLYSWSASWSSLDLLVTTECNFGSQCTRIECCCWERCREHVL